MTTSDRTTSDGLIDSRAPLVPLHKNVDYRWLISGQTVSVIGTSITTFAFLYYTLDVTGSATLATTVSASHALASALVGLPGGALVDRMSRRRVLIWSTLISSGLMAALVFVHLTLGAIPVPVLALGAFMVGASNSFYSPAERGLLKEIVPPSQLGTAMAVNQGRFSLGSLIGPPLSGLLFAAGRAVPFLFDVVTYVFAAFAASRVRHVEVPRQVDSGSIFRQIFQGFAWLRKSGPLFAIGWYSTLLNFSMMGIITTVTVHLQQSGETAFSVGIFQGVYGAAGIAGAVWSTSLMKKVSIGWIAVLGAVGFAVTLSLTALVGSYMVLLALVSGCALVLPVFNSATGAYFMTCTPSAMQGRASSVLATSAAVLIPLGIWVSGALVDMVGRPWAVAFFSAVLLCVTAAFVARADVRSMPRAEDLDEAVA